MSAPARQRDGLRALARLAGNAGDVREVRAPLAALQPVSPGVPHQHAAVARGVRRCRDGPEVVLRHGDKDPAAGSVRLASTHGALGDESLVRPRVVGDLGGDRGCGRLPLTALSLAAARIRGDASVTRLEVRAGVGRTMRIAFTSAELMRGLWRIDCGMGARHVGQDVLLCCTHLVKQPRQKLCWQGACAASVGFLSPGARRQSFPRRAPSQGARTG